MNTPRIWRLFGIGLTVLIPWSCRNTDRHPLAAPQASTAPGTPAVTVPAPDPTQGEADSLAFALSRIEAQGLKQKIAVLSSDEFEGRAPSTPGEDKTTAYIEGVFKKNGLRPGNRSSFFQEIPLVEMTVDPSMVLSILGRKKPVRLKFKDDFAGGTLQARDRITITGSKMIFVGYGIVAPEHDWNDYQGVDVRGKTAVMLVNDPGFATGSPDLFKGREMTYYGRWTYKFEEAARQGAAAALLIHDTEPATYGWQVVENGWTGPQYSMATKDGNAGRCGLEAWITLDSAKKIFESAGLSLDELTSQASKPGFKAVPMGTSVTIDMRIKLRNTVTKNVLGFVRGTDRPGEVIIYTAHWDHLGRDPSLTGDQIFNGALDNATGTAGLLELAEAFSALEPAPLRSIVLFATAAEEQGLLGTEYYASHPVFPLAKTVAIINMDSLNIWGPMKDIRLVGLGQSELDAYVIEAAREQSRTVLPDLMPEKGSFFRSDHFPFAKRGIPVINAQAGNDHSTHGPQWGLAQKVAYQKQNYHKPSDEFDSTWDLTGAIDDIRLLFKVGYRLSRESVFPDWKPNGDYKAKRDEMMPGRQ